MVSTPRLKVLAMGSVQIRSFSASSMAFKSSISIVKPVHHRVKIKLEKLQQRFPEKRLDKEDPHSPRYRPAFTHQDRVDDHLRNTVQPDLLLVHYEHNSQRKEGLKTREWDMTSPYHVNRPPRRPFGKVDPLPDIRPRTSRNLPKLEEITLSAYVAESAVAPHLPISVALQLQQISNGKPHRIYAKSNILSFKLREGMKMGAKVTLSGRAMNQFVSTLTELVLPRIRLFEGIKNSSGDRLGNISFGMTAEDVKYFPEIAAFQELFPDTFGMHVTFKTSAQTDSEARTLLSGYGLPFKGTEKYNYWL